MVRSGAESEPFGIAISDLKLSDLKSGLDRFPLQCISDTCLIVVSGICIFAEDFEAFRFAKNDLELSRFCFVDDLGDVGKGGSEVNVGEVGEACCGTSDGGGLASTLVVEIVLRGISSTSELVFSVRSSLGLLLLGEVDSGVSGGEFGGTGPRDAGSAFDSVRDIMAGVCIP